MASVFVGEGRKALVKGIVDQLDNLTDFRGDSCACLISLEAPSGWGKTRVIQEVYKHIAERQSSPYWPLSIIPESEDDPVSRRKHLVPSFEGVARDRKVLPEFFWWGLTCDMRSTNMLSRTLMEDIEQLHFHAPYLEASWAASKLTGLGKYATIAKAKSALGGLFEEGATTGLAKLAELGLGATPFGIGLGLKLVTGGVKAAKDRREEVSRMELGSEGHKAADEDLIDETVNLFARLAHKDLPIIICVEDIHKATSPVLELLAKLVARNAPILILTTTWPGEFEKISELNSLLETSWGPERILRMVYDQPAPKGLPEDASLAQLPSKDLAEIICARYPKAETETITLLAQRYKNPLPLELVLSMKSLSLDHPYLELAVEDIEELPETVRDLYNSLWNELPEQVQQLLALSTELMPDDQPEWLMSLMAEVSLQMSDEVWVKDISETVANDNIPHGWARTIEGWLRRFGEADQLEIARKHVRELFGKRQLRQFYETVAVALEAFDFNNADIDDAEAIHKAWLIVTFFRESDSAIDTYLSASLFILNYSRNNPLEWPRSISLAETIIKKYQDTKILSNEQIHILALIESCLAGILGLSGKFEEADKHLNSVLIKRAKLSNESQSEIFTTKGNIAFWLSKRGQFKNALNIYKELLEDNCKNDQLDMTSKLICRINYACLLGSCGKISDALNELLLLERGLVHTLEEPNQYLLNIRSNIAFYESERGNFKRAIEISKKLLKDDLKIFGANDPETFIPRLNIAVWEGQLGNLELAISLLKDLLTDQTKVLGDSHLETLRTRHNIAFLTGENGDYFTAIKITKKLLSEKFTLFNKFHPDVFPTRSNLAYLYKAMGEFEIALTIYEDLLLDQNKVFDFNHPATLTTKGHIAELLGSVGRKTESLQEFEKLLKTQQEILGDQHPDVFLTKRCIAELYCEIGDFKNGIDLMKSILSNQIDSLGDSHPDVFSSMYDLIHYYGENGNYNQAILITKRLLALQKKNHAYHHNDLFLTRSIYAFWLSKAGKIRVALESYKHLSVDMKKSRDAKIDDILVVDQCIENLEDMIKNDI